MSHPPTTTTLLLGSALLLVAVPTATNVEAIKAQVNARLATAGADFQLAEIELMMAPGGGKGKNKAPTYDFVPGDVRRHPDGSNDITWAIDDVDVTLDVSVAAALGAIEDALVPYAMERCASGLVLPRVHAPGIDLGVLQSQLAGTDPAPRVADITHGGWLPGLFFNFFEPGVGATSVLALTATFVFNTGVLGSPTDLDGDGAADVSHRETYYNDELDWDTTGGDIDIQTVAMHEIGHLLGLDDIAMTLAPGTDPSTLTFAFPAGVYSGVERELSREARRAFCANWRHWPKR